MSNLSTLPLTCEFNLGSIGRNGTDWTLDASLDERARIAQWADILVVASFSATLHLKKHSATRFSLEGELLAVVEQACVVTLEPVPARFVVPIHRELHLTETAHALRSGALSEGAGDDEMPEEIETLHYDLAAPLLEEFALALDPYPRAKGVEFVAPGEGDAGPESPFAVLKKLGK